MSADYQNRPKIKLADVREYQSANGKQYFSFYLGSAKALLFKDEKAEPTGNAVGVWRLLLEETDPKPKQQQSASGQRSPVSDQSRPAAGQSRTAQDARAREALRDRGIDPASVVSEDELPF